MKGNRGSRELGSVELRNRELKVREWVEKNRLLSNRKININISKEGGKEMLVNNIKDIEYKKIYG
ncbi:MAG: hypothetical protein ACLR5O_02970, partial [Romboutsia timonensis]|uniref:hypothetical protein n=1 Tax=Romboutsia timonensis TaxID=1776391 RepID=UPI0039A13667